MSVKLIDDRRVSQSMITSIYISVKPEFVGIENGVGEGLADVEPAWTYVVRGWKRCAEWS
jgi:hypothetical protein